METPLYAQAIYTLILAVSAALVLYAALVSLRHLYPSLRLFYGKGAERFADEVPYGALIAVVILGFAFTAYVTPATILAGIALLILAGCASMGLLPVMTLRLAAFVLSALALLADIDMLKENGFTPMEMGLAVGFLAAPVLAAFAPAKGMVNNSALGILAMIGLAAVVIGPLVTQSFAHGTAAAAVVFAGISVGLTYLHRHGGAVGAGTLMALVLLMAHSALVLGHSGMMIAGLVMMGAVVVVGAIAASGQAAR